jgi:deazaflavin-dependent oxidoreductase (nitroreductase family)
MATETPAIKLPGTPKPWMNSAVKTMLRTPGVRSVLGRMMIILTVTGAKTGIRYTTPVQYVQDGDRLLVLSQRKRLWWRNITDEPEVAMVLKGRTIRTNAHLAEGDEARTAIATCLRLDPRLAKFYGIELDQNGEPSDDDVAKFDAAFTVIVIYHPHS